jgi:hypothetical protein
MRKRAARIGIAALVLIVAGATPAYDTLVSSAQTVERYIEGFKAGDSSLSPLERLVFGLVMANSKPTHPRNAGTAPERRT